MDVDAVGQRARESRPISRDVGRRADARAAGATQPAGTRIGRADQLEARRKGHRVRRPRDHHSAILQRLPHRVEYMTRQLQQFIEKKHATVRETHLTRTRPRATADETGQRNRVVRRAKRRRARWKCAGNEQAADAMHRDHLVQLALGQRRQDARESPRQHRLASTRRAREQNVVASRCRDLQRAPRDGLAHHVREVGRRLRRGAHVRDPRRGRWPAVPQRGDEHGKGWRARHAGNADQRGLCRVALWHHQRAGRHSQGALRQRQDSPNRANPAVETKLARHQQSIGRCGRQLACGNEQAERDGQVKGRTVLAHVGRREIDGDAPRGHLEPGVGDGGQDALARLLHSTRGQADNRPRGESAGDIDFDGHIVRFHAEHGGRLDGGEHPERSVMCAHHPHAFNAGIIARTRDAPIASRAEPPPTPFSPPRSAGCLACRAVRSSGSPRGQTS